MNTRSHRRFGERGSVMTLALGFMVVLLVIAAGVHGLVLNQLQSSGRLRQRIAAEDLAEGGIARTVGWFNATGYQLPAVTLLNATVPVRLKRGNAPVVLPSNHPSGYTDALGQTRTGVVASYQSYLSSQQSGVGTYSVVTSLIALQPETWEAVATARAGTVQQQVGALLIREQQSLFSDAIFGRGPMSLGGNASTDSYDATLGPYGGSNVFQSGNVRSNGSITLNGNATVKGDAMPGPNGSVSTAGNATVTGLTDPAKAEKQLPAITVPGNAVSIGPINLKARDVQTLTAGTYVADSLDISANAQLIVNTTNGPVNLYVRGSVSIGGNGIANTGGVPKNFNLVQVGGGDVSFTGNANFSGTVYAPDSVLKLNGNGQMYGSFVGAGVSVGGNGAFHFDQSLRSIPGPPGAMKLVAQWTPPTF